MPAPGTKKMEGSKSIAASRSGRGSVSNENNVLLDPEVLTDYPTQVLVLTVLVSMFDVLKFQTLVACQKCLDKHRRSRSDCF